MELSELQHVVRAIIQAAPKPVTFEELMLAFTREENVTGEQIRSALQNLLEANDPVQELKEIAGGYRYQIKTQYAPWIRRVQGMEDLVEKNTRIMNEVLAIIVYKQPISRQEIDLIRGASTNLSVIQQLEERGWIKIVAYGGKKHRAALYGTTVKFLEHFGLNSICELPCLEKNIV
jgi:segregation and condensation protein B